jgi:SAM-dependent methyltransferase
VARATAAADDGGADASGVTGTTATILREVLSRGERQKLDASPDAQFYAYPRLVTHVDANFIAQLTQLYRERLPAGGDVLDLCSSWVSHLPRDVRYGRVVGHGMNAVELARNRQLSEFFVRDLNKSPSGWALGDASVDAALCCCSVQYLQSPELVLAELHRVLRPGGVLVISFSNRMFYDKAVKVWRDGTDFSRVSLVKQYVGAVAGFSAPEVVTRVELPAEKGGGGGGGAFAAMLPAPLSRFFDRVSAASSDPFWAVVAYKE